MCSLLYIIVIHTNNFTDKIKPIFFTSRIFKIFEELLSVLMLMLRPVVRPVVMMVMMVLVMILTLRRGDAALGGEEERRGEEILLVCLLT